jgi:hypothetical protein
VEGTAVYAEKRLAQILTERGNVVPTILNERQQRLISGSIAKGYGYGGDKIVSAAFGLDPRTVSSGRKAIEAGKIDDLEEDRIRQIGGGRKQAKELQPRLLENIEDIIRNNTYGDPEQVLFWTSLSLRDISEELGKRGFDAGKDVVSRSLEELGYSKQTNQKHIQVGKAHPGRDEMFRFINEKAEEFIKDGEPVISTDTKKKELIGNFKNNGQEYRKENDPRKVLDHDFAIPELGKVAPYGVYVLNDNTGFINLGTDHDTGEFAVESIRRWIWHIGTTNFPDMNKILIVCDSGGSNGWRQRLWKYQLALLAEETGLELHICHMPPGTSKWNKIEHKLFCYISKNWAGKPLLDIQTVVNYIANTKTKGGLVVNCEVDYNQYEKAIKISDDQIETIDLERVGPYGDYAYIIRGFKKCK